MQVEAYRKLIDEICLKSGIPDPASMYTEANLQMMGVNFSMYHCLEPTKDFAILYGDFGPLPKQGRESVLLRLMQINLHLYNGISPTFSCHPDNNHVILVTAIPVLITTVHAFMELLVGLADMALSWQNGHFLNEEEQAGAPAGGLLEASQSTFNRFSSQFSKSKTSAQEHK